MTCLDTSLPLHAVRNRLPALCFCYSEAHKRILEDFLAECIFNAFRKHGDPLFEPAILKDGAAPIGEKKQEGSPDAKFNTTPREAPQEPTQRKKQSRRAAGVELGLGTCRSGPSFWSSSYPLRKNARRPRMMGP